ncbi:hypothetical protein V7S43_012765 [Phytophthora oleae]|uniref:M96 mating-specific protein family n=1 Tax=Phytophthora oleae TaxID=2107226 RepID=A0ABD3FA99_9STRA
MADLEALLDEAPDVLTALQVPEFLSSFADWEPDLHQGILDEDIGDLSGVETSTLTPSETSLNYCSMDSDSASLDAVNAFADEAKYQSNSGSAGGAGSLSSLGGDEWDTELLLSDIGDFGSELEHATPLQLVNAPAVANTSNDVLTRTTNSLVKKLKRKKINPNKARDERRFQLLELQQQVAELEFTLERRQTIRNKRLKRIQHPSCYNNGVPRVWQEICSRQISRRLEAEWENLQLKKQYEKEKQLVKSFNKLLDKRRVPFIDAERQATTQTRRIDIPAGYIERMAALIFKELAAGVKTCYSKVESAFETNRPVPMNLVSHSSLLDKGISMKGTEQRFYDKRTMPFDMRATGAAWWENWHNFRGRRFQDLAANEITESFGLEMNDLQANTSATAYSQQISHRHVEDDRIVYVWDAYIEPFGFANERVGGVYFLEQNYVLIQPEDWSSERAFGGSNGFSTRVSICYVITPHFLDPKLKEDAKTGALINFLVSALSTKIMALNEMVETLLLDQALQQHQ